MLFKDLDIKSKALSVLKEFNCIYDFSNAELSEDKVEELKTYYERALSILDSNKEHFCMLAALRTLSFQLAEAEDTDSLSNTEVNISNLTEHIDDDMTEFVLTNF